MTKEELIEFLKENMTIDVDTTSDYYDYKGLKVTISVCGQEICSSEAGF